MQLKTVGSMLKETASEWSSDKASRLGAALAYYSVFSIGPLLMIVISIAGLAFGEDAARGELFGNLQAYLGTEGAGAAQALLETANKPAVGWGAGIIGFVTLVFGAVGVVVQLKDALNTIWEVKPRPGRGLKVFLKTYIISVAAILGIGFLLLVSLALSAAVSAAGSYFSTYLPLPESVLQAVNTLVSFAVITALFAMMFRWLPDVRLEWKDVLLGAALTAFLFVVGKFLIGLYLGKQSIGSAYGAAGSLVVLLVWIYYSAQIFFFGAEFTQVYARRQGSKIQPTQDAVLMSVEERKKEGLDPKLRSRESPEQRGKPPLHPSPV